jgi:ribosomal protein S27AE
MSTKHIRTIADLVRFGAGLKIECANCGAARTVDGYEAAKMAGPQSLMDLGRRLKCGRCGKKEALLSILPPV